MSEELLQNKPFKATLKSGAGYEAPWISVEAGSGEELVSLLDQLTDEVLQKVTDVTALFRGAHVVSAGGTTEGTEGNSQGQQQASGGSVTALKTCAHGVRKKVEGNGKRGKWVGYFCPLEKGDPNQCAPIWED